MEARGEGMTEQIEAFMIAARRLLHASLPVLLTFGPMVAAAQRPPVAPGRTVTDRYYDAGHGLGSTRSQREVELAEIPNCTTRIDA